MERVPFTSKTILLRTEFSDDAKWSQLCTAAQEPSEGDEFQAEIECISDKQYANATIEQIVEAASKSPHSIILVADGEAINHSERPILCIDLDEEPGRHFRVVPNVLWSVENNLSIANMDFFEFAESTDKDGIFRGF